MKKHLCLLLYFLLPVSAISAPITENPRFRAVKAYLLAKDDYPELFKDKPYKLQVEDVVIADLDGDQQDEVVLQMKPHYRQSPTIVIFRVDANMKVTRVVEGLAPGPLLPISGEYLDSHTMGMAVDMQIEPVKDGQTEPKPVIELLFKNFGGVVEYKNWYHVDNRSGRKLYIDMRNHDIPKHEVTCANFEFSTIKKIWVGQRRGTKGNYLLAYVEGKIYAYKIHQFLNNGLMKKSLEILTE